MLQVTDVDVRQLAALVAVADHGTFGRAAAHLGFSQSAVSQQIAALERLVGLGLFDRPGGPKAPTLTPAGALLLGHARVLLARLGEAADDLDRLARGVTGTLRIGTFQSVSTNVLPAVMARLRHELPGVDVRIFELDEQEGQVHRLLAGELDLAFVVGLEDDERLRVHFLGEDPYVLLLEGEVPEGPVPLRHLDGLQMVGQPEGDVCQVNIVRTLTDNGIQPDYVFRTVDNAAVVAMVRSGMGPAIMPFLAIDPTDRRISVRDLDPPIPARRIGIASVTGRTLAPAAERFVETTRTTCADLLRALPVG